MAIQLHVHQLHFKYLAVGLNCIKIDVIKLNSVPRYDFKSARFFKLGTNLNDLNDLANAVRSYERSSRESMCSVSKGENQRDLTTYIWCEGPYI
jgi:hypothetical protein